MSYKELYTQAWNSWADSWKMQGIEAYYVIETSWKDKLFYIEVHACARKPVLVHKESGSTEEEAWEAALSTILLLGAAKVYEGIVELHRANWIRKSNQEDPQRRYKALFPLKPDDVKLNQ